MATPSGRTRCTCACGRGAIGRSIFRRDGFRRRLAPLRGAIYGADNPLIGYPLAYQYLTTVRPDALPRRTPRTSSACARVAGGRAIRSVRSTSRTGLPLMTAFRWDTGVQVRVGDDVAAIQCVALTNGTASDPRTRDNNGGQTDRRTRSGERMRGWCWADRRARGPYVSDEALATLRCSPPMCDRSQPALGLDVELSRDHWLVRGEAIWNQWQMPTLAHVSMRPAFSSKAATKCRQGFSWRVASTGSTSARCLLRSTVRRGMRPSRGSRQVPATTSTAIFLAKLTYQHNWRDGGLIRSKGLVALQFHFWL